MPPRTALLNVLLARGDDLDVTPVGNPRVIAESHQPVLDQDHTLNRRVRLVEIRDCLGQFETGHYVRQNGNSIPQRLTDETLAIRLIRQRQHRLGVSMVDKAVRQKGVNERLDRRHGSRRVKEIPPELVDHRVVVERVQQPKVSQLAQVHRRHPAGFDPRQIPAPALDVDRVDFVATDRSERSFQRHVAAAVKNQFGFPTDQVGRIEPECEVLAVPVAPPFDRLQGSLIVPAVFHARSSLRIARSKGAILILA